MRCNEDTIFLGHIPTSCLPRWGGGGGLDPKRPPPNSAESSYLAANRRWPFPLFHSLLRVLAFFFSSSPLPGGRGCSNEENFHESTSFFFGSLFWCICRKSVKTMLKTFLLQCLTPFIRTKSFVRKCSWYFFVHYAEGYLPLPKLHPLSNFLHCSTYICFGICYITF